MILEKEFKWLEISLFFGKSDQHAKMFDSYNPKLTSTFLGKVGVGNNSNTYSVENDLEFKLTKKDQKHQIYKVCALQLQRMFYSSTYRSRSQ